MSITHDIATAITATMRRQSRPIQRYYVDDERYAALKRELGSTLYLPAQPAKAQTPAVMICGVDVLPLSAIMPMSPQ